MNQRTLFVPGQKGIEITTSRVCSQVSHPLLSPAGSFSCTLWKTAAYGPADRQRSCAGHNALSLFPLGQDINSDSPHDGKSCSQCHHPVLQAQLPRPPPATLCCLEPQPTFPRPTPRPWANLNLCRREPAGAGARPRAVVKPFTAARS